MYHMLKIAVKWLIVPGSIALALVLVCEGMHTQTVLAKGLGGPHPARNIGALVEPIKPEGDTLPALMCRLRTNKVTSSFNSFGQFGTGLLPAGGILEQFEMPPGSYVNYLFGGAYWIGGIVGSDTIVSVGADGWQNINELNPDGFSSVNPDLGSIREVAPIGDTAYRSDCTDTIHDFLPIFYDVITHQPARPLPIKIATRVHLWETPPADRCFLYDVVVTNIGSQTIEQGYAGLYIDGDVGSIQDLNSPNDDVTGSLQDSGIAYIVDNNGDFQNANKSLGALGVRLLAQSWAGNHTSYNWWVSNANSNLDFGPMKNANYRDFLTAGATGTPEGGANKYWLMSKGEWDYNQVKTITTGINDTTWRPVNPPLAPYAAKGTDTKFLLSFGPFTLLPDSSARFIFSLFGADSVHTNEGNGEYILNPDSIDPDKYEAGLDLASIYRSGTVAESLAQFLLDPVSPVYGLRVVRNIPDSVTIEWDDWCFPTIDGYNIYIQDSAGISPTRRPGAAPLTLLTQVGRQHRYTVTGITPGDHLLYVTTRFGNQTGSMGDSLPIHFDSHTGTGSDTPPLPLRFATQNYPNPFNPSTTISFTLPTKAEVRIEIFNASGQVVRTLGNIEMAAGEHALVWDGQTSSGHAAASGVYLYRLTAGTNVATRKMLLLK
ncbi:MAG: FlgD immunoglobulin-like domain containing protein [Candidatus Zixiibacteriota bacterium]